VYKFLWHVVVAYPISCASSVTEPPSFFSFIILFFFFLWLACRWKKNSILISCCEPLNPWPLLLHYLLYMPQLDNSISHLHFSIGRSGLMRVRLQPLKFSRDVA
jgi:hypothetical protein